MKEFLSSCTLATNLIEKKMFILTDYHVSLQIPKYLIVDIGRDQILNWSLASTTLNLSP